MIWIPKRTVATTTVSFPRKRTNVPTELSAATLKMLLAKVANAFLAPEQKLTP